MQQLQMVLWLGIPWVLLLVLVLFDATKGERTKRRNRGTTERFLWGVTTHLGLIAAIVAGVSITVIGHLVEIHCPAVEKWLEGLGGKGLIKFVEVWAPHFGPELIVLAFAALFVERALRKREQLRALRFRTVQGFMYLVNYALQHHLYFDGGSSNFLKMERDALKQRSEARRRALWSDELGLFDDVQNTAYEFIHVALQFVWAVERVNDERANLRAALLGRETAANFWETIGSLEANAEAVFRRVPLSSGQSTKLTIDDLFEKDRREDWQRRCALLANQSNAGGVLDGYFLNYWVMIEFRVEVLNTFSAFQAAVLLFRNRVWETDNPDE